MTAPKKKYSYSYKQFRIDRPDGGMTTIKIPDAAYIELLKKSGLSMREFALQVRSLYFTAPATHWAASRRVLNELNRIYQ